MNSSECNRFPFKRTMQEPSVRLSSLCSNKLQCMDECGAADMLLELIQFQEAYIASGNLNFFFVLVTIKLIKN